MYFFSLFVACSLVKMLSEFACLDVTISQSNSDDCTSACVLITVEVLHYFSGRMYITVTSRWKQRPAPLPTAFEQTHIEEV